jgi:hypothetical protein
MFQALVTEEGVSIENSLGYHRATQEMCHFIEDLDDRSGERLSPICRSMAEFSESIRYPDGGGPSFGDTFFTLNSLGSFRTCAPDAESYVRTYEKSGYSVARSADTDACWQLAFFAPNLSATHKHADHLSVTFWADGVEWIVDPGFYSHHYEEPISRFGRGYRGHNLPYFDGIEYTIEPGFAEISSQISEDGKNFTFRGKHRAIRGLIVKRTVKGTVGERRIRIHDEVTRDPPAETTLPSPQFYLQFGDTVEARLEGTKLTLDSELSQARLILHLPPAVDCAIDEGVEDAEDIRGWVFPGFAQKFPAPALHCDLGQMESFDWSIELR